MSRFAGASCKSILYCNPEHPPPITATLSTPVARPCFASNVLTLFAALAVNFMSRSSPVRKDGAEAGLLATALIIVALNVPGSLRAVNCRYWRGCRVRREQSRGAGLARAREFNWNISVEKTLSLCQNATRTVGQVGMSNPAIIETV